MPAIFLSHASADRTVSADIVAELKRLGFEEVFLDYDSIVPGENWEKRLYEELSRCHAVVLVMTPAWLASKWCFNELSQARALGKVVLPVLCAPVGQERLVLPEVQAIDLIDWNSEGLARLKQRLLAIANELARGFPLDPTRPPYPGMNAFEAEDAAIYFGRDDETRAVIERLDARRIQGGARFLIIIGASGSGKSSLLKASVLPQLGRRRTQWLPLPLIRPERAPMEALAKALALQMGAPDTWREWHARLLGPNALTEIDTLLRDTRVGEGRAASVLLPIDQFEEMFTTAEATERDAFLKLLAAAFERDLPFLVIATGRADVLEGLIEKSGIANRLETYPLTAMPLERVPRLVEGPAMVAGIHIEQGLPERIAQDVESADALPLLAHMLALLNRRGGGDKRLTIAEYESLGDPANGLNPIQNSIKLAADQTIADRKPNERELDALRDAFVPHLVRVRLDDGKRVRQPARMAELPPESLRLVRALIEARLLSTRATEAPGSDRPEMLVEATHEALFRAWPTLDQWLKEEHAFLSDLERIRAAHAIWTQTADDQKSGELLRGLLLSRTREWLARYPQRFLGRDMEALAVFIRASAEAEDAERAREAARQRTVRWLIGSAAAAAVLFVAASFSGYQYFAARQAQASAESAAALAAVSRTAAETQKDLAERATRAADLATRAADEARRAKSDADEARKQAVAEKDRAVAAERAALDSRAKTLLTQGEQNLRGADFSTALQTLGEVVAGYAQFDAANALFGKLKELLFSVAIRRPDIKLIVPYAAPSDDQLVTFGETNSSESECITTEGADDIQAAAKGNKLTESSLRQVTYQPTGRLVAIGPWRDLFDAQSGAWVHRFLPSGPKRDAVFGFAFERSGELAATLTSAGAIERWDISARTVTNIETPAEKPIGIQGGARGNEFFVIYPRRVDRWTYTPFRRGQTVLTSRQNVFAVSPDGSRFIDYTATPVKTADGQDENLILRYTLKAADGRVIAALEGDSPKFQAGGTKILTFSDDTTVSIWDASNGRRVGPIDAKGQEVADAYPVADAALSADGNLLFTTARFASIKYWNAMTGKYLGTVLSRENTGHNAHLALNPDNNSLVTFKLTEALGVCPPALVKLNPLDFARALRLVFTPPPITPVAEETDAARYAKANLKALVARDIGSDQTPDVKKALREAAVPASVIEALDGAFSARASDGFKPTSIMSTTAKTAFIAEFGKPSKDGGDDPSVAIFKVAAGGIKPIAACTNDINVFQSPGQTIAASADGNVIVMIGEKRFAVFDLARERCSAGDLLENVDFWEIVPGERMFQFKASYNADNSTLTPVRRHLFLIDTADATVLQDFEADDVDQRYFKLWRDLKVLDDPVGYLREAIAADKILRGDTDPPADPAAPDEKK